MPLTLASITNQARKRKRILVLATVLLVGFVSFVLGRLSVTDDRARTSSPAVPYQTTTLPDINSSSQSAQSSEVRGETADVSVVGSKNSDVYHFGWCSGAQRIAEDNLVTFASIEAAKQAGYRPAANCEGLH